MHPNARGGFGAALRAAFDKNFPRAIITLRLRGDGQARDGPDGRQGFAAKSHRVDVEQVPFPRIIGRKLRGGMAFYGDGEFFGAHPLTIICYGNCCAPAIFIADVHLGRACIYSVFDEFLDNTGRSLNNLPRRDAVNGLGRKPANRYGAVRHKKA